MRVSQVSEFGWLFNLLLEIIMWIKLMDYVAGRDEIRMEKMIKMKGQ